MDIDWLALVLRWLHIVAAVAAVGGTIFMRVALVPAAAGLPEDAHRALSEAIRRRWSKVVMAAILFLLVSGLWNFLTINASFKAAGLKIPALYHPLFGVKFLLALGIFYIASSLAGRSAATAKFRANAKTWLTVNMVLGILVICISGVLRMTHNAPDPNLPRLPAAAAAPAEPTP
jgi:uncharacterized membrane protein